jgi:lipopolysaccharide transport system ATP-binding protein
MALIELNRVCVDFPIFNANNRSLKNTILQSATGGKVDFGAKETIVRSLIDVTFKIEPGERVGLIGHNGAGKSTLLRTLSRVYIPTQGKAKIEGTIGSLVDISLGIDPEATGRENILVRGVLMGLKRSEILARMQEIIEFSELGSFIDMPVRTYSSGMHLRLAFSISTIIRPEILIMDEWLSVGDDSFNQKAAKRLNEMVETSQILVIASHSRGLVEQICTRALWFEHGKLKMDGVAREVCQQYWG